MSNKVMKRAGAVTLLALSAAVSFAVHAKHGDLTLAVTMTNDPSTNQIKVYDAATGALLQTLPPAARVGFTGNASGVRQHDGELFAAVNNGSNTVACSTGATATASSSSAPSQPSARQ